MAKIPRQRGGGDTGNTGWGHRSNRVNSGRRGGNPHAGGGGRGGACGLIVFGSAAFVLASAVFGVVEFL